MLGFFSGKGKVPAPDTFFLDCVGLRGGEVSEDWLGGERFLGDARNAPRGLNLGGEKLLVDLCFSGSCFGWSSRAGMEPACPKSMDERAPSLILLLCCPGTCTRWMSSVMSLEGMLRVGGNVFGRGAVAQRDRTREDFGEVVLGEETD